MYRIFKILGKGNKYLQLQLTLFMPYTNLNKKINFTWFNIPGSPGTKPATIRLKLHIL